MTIADLIDELKRYPLNNEVQLVGSDDLGMGVDSVLESDDGKIVYIYADEV